MCLCLLQKVHNPPVQRIHRGKRQPKSLRASPWERNVGKGREREQKRNRSHLPRYTSAEARCPVGGERCSPGYASARRWLSPGVGGPSVFLPRGTCLSPERLRSAPRLAPPAASPVPVTYQEPVSAQAGAAPPAAAAASVSRGGSK